MATALEQLVIEIQRANQDDPFVVYRQTLLDLVGEFEEGGVADTRHGVYLTVADLILAPGSQGFLTWVHSEGDVLLDVSDDETPLIVDDGVYAFSGSVGPNEAFVDGPYQTVLRVGNRQTGIDIGSPTDVNQAPIGLVYTFLADDEVTVRIKNNDSIEHGFSFVEMMIQKLA